MIDDTQVSKDLDGLDNIDSFWDSARLGARDCFAVPWFLLGRGGKKQPSGSLFVRPGRVRVPLCV